MHRIAVRPSYSNLVDFPIPAEVFDQASLPIERDHDKHVGPSSLQNTKRSLRSRPLLGPARAPLIHE